MPRARLRRATRDIDAAVTARSQRTGSCPHPPHGLHRAMRLAAIHPPRATPCRLNASTAYSEQDG
jgi:hypothetical protein